LTESHRSAARSAYTVGVVWVSEHLFDLSDRQAMFCDVLHIALAVVLVIPIDKRVLHHLCLSPAMRRFLIHGSGVSGIRRQKYVSHMMQ
jgi:hypothetical protein